MHGFFDPPRHQQMDIPIGGLEHAAKAPGRDRAWRPAGQLFQGFPPWKEGLHAHQPAQDEAMTAFPDAGHPTKQDCDEQRQVGDCDHRRPSRAKGVNENGSGIPAVLLYHMTPSTLICKVLEVEDVVFELLSLCPVPPSGGQSPLWRIGAGRRVGRSNYDSAVPGQSGPGLEGLETYAAIPAHSLVAS